MQKFLLYIIVLSCFFTKPVFAQVPGCRDPQANNYNTLVTTNDGSCLYNQTSHTPVTKVDPLNILLIETSGLQWAANSLWTFNDGGGAAAIYKIDTVSNVIFQTVTLEGASNIDWEDIAFDGAYFYIGDFGNNLNGARSNLKIYKFSIAAIPDHITNATVTIPQNLIEVINFSYADQPQPLIPVAANTTKFDCEAMVVDNNAIHLFTKNWVDNNTSHYIINGTNAGTYVANNLESLSTNYLVTGADKAPGEQIILLLGYQNSGSANHFLHVLSDYGAGLFFNGNKRKINLPDVFTMGQAEGITFRNSTYGYISNEKFTRTIGTVTLTTNPKLQAFNTSSFTSNYLLPVDLTFFDIKNNHGSHSIKWNFTREIDMLQLQHSNNGSHFSQIAVQPKSTTGNFIYKSTQSKNYYRLAWADGQATKYSNVLFIVNDPKKDFNILSLTTDGKFSFELANSAAESYSFKFINAAGKILATFPGQIYFQGNHRLSIKAAPLLQGMIYVIAKSENETFTKLVFIQ